MTEESSASNHLSVRSATVLTRMIYHFNKAIIREPKFGEILGSDKNEKLKVWRAKRECKARN